MRPLQILLLSLLCFTLASAIFIEGGYGGGKGSFSASSSSEEGGRGHQHHHHRPRRPHRPRPPRPPRSSEEEPPRNRRCPSGWETFQRSQGNWCVKVLYGPATYVAAQAACEAQQAKLSGVQDASERMRVAALARTVLNQNGGGQAEVWLGAYRRPNCPYASSCPGIDTFEWTDGSTTGNAGFTFGPGEPNGVIFPNSYSNLPWGQQNCLVELISGNSDIASFGYPHGSLDDQHCQGSWRMMACGKAAK